MSFGTFCAILFLMVIAYFFILSLKGIRPMPFIDDEDETTVTTTTTTSAEATPAEPNIVGNLKRQIEGTQAFVIDPVDQQKTWLNSNDDMYEDANGKIWRVV